MMRLKSITLPELYRYVAIVTSIATLLLFGWRAMNSISHVEVHCDPGMFLSGAYHLLSGRVLYQDVWDHKPPMIFALNALALKIGGYSVDSARMMERILVCVGILMLYLVCRKYFRSRWIAWLSGILFVINLYNPVALVDGNYTEEYGAIFVLIASSCVIASAISSPKIHQLYAAVSGFFFCCAALTKEPFVLTSIPWFMFLVCGKADLSLRKRVNIAGCFIAGVSVPLLAFAYYLFSHHILPVYIDTLMFGLSNNESSAPLLNRLIQNLPFARQKMLDQFTLFPLLAFSSLLLLTSTPLRRKYGSLLLTVLAAFFSDFVGTALSPRHFEHYYLQLVPSFTFCMMLGLVAIRQISRQLDRARWIVPGIGIIMALWLDVQPIQSLFTRWMQPFQPYSPSEFASYLRKIARPGDTLWSVSLNYTELYLETEMLSPTRYYAFFTHQFIDTPLETAQQKFDSVVRALQTQPPTFILVEPHYTTSVLFESGLFEWIQAEYVSAGYGNDHAEIFIKKERLADHPLP